MELQVQIDSFQKLVFSHFHQGTNNEYKIASLMPPVHESYGIYRFVTSMPRAMHPSTRNDEVLEPQYNAQHYRLVKFYFECLNLRYLTSLLTVPKFPQDPPNLMSEEDYPLALPKRPASEPPQGANSTYQRLNQSQFQISGRMNRQSNSESTKSSNAGLNSNSSTAANGSSKTSTGTVDEGSAYNTNTGKIGGDGTAPGNEGTVGQRPGRPTTL